MASLQVRELPDLIYHKLKLEADKKHRSLARHATITLAKGLESSLISKERRLEILSDLKRNTQKIREFNLSNPVDLIRDDRGR